MTELEKLYVQRDVIARRITVAELRKRAQENPHHEYPDAGNRRGWAQCGTDGGYYRHIRYNREPACPECKAAHALESRLREARKRERSNVCRG